MIVLRLQETEYLTNESERYAASMGRQEPLSGMRRTGLSGISGSAAQSRKDVLLTGGRGSSMAAHGGHCCINSKFSGQHGLTATGCGQKS
jgi:hypothetical protein